MGVQIDLFKGVLSHKHKIKDLKKPYVFDDNVTVNGTLTINGSLVQNQGILVHDVLIEDNVILLNNGETGAGVTLGNAGIEIDRGTLDNSYLEFNETDGLWHYGFRTGLDFVINEPTVSHFSKLLTVSKVSDTQITYVCGDVNEALQLSSYILGNIVRWTDSTETTIKRGFIKSISLTGLNLTINLNGNVFASGDTNFRISYNHKIKQHQAFIPGELLADSEDVGMEFIFPFNSRIISVDSFLKYAATGGSESLKYNFYLNGTAIFTTDRQHTTNTSLKNQLPNTNTVTVDDKGTIRITESTGTTTKAIGLTLIIYYQDYNLWEL